MKQKTGFDNSIGNDLSFEISPEVDDYHVLIMMF